ncbi:MAG: hypothetical protein ACOC2L_05315 [Candidatus Sumerlaeota bacterium]
MVLDCIKQNAWDDFETYSVRRRRNDTPREILLAGLFFVIVGFILGVFLYIMAVAHAPGLTYWSPNNGIMEGYDDPDNPNDEPQRQLGNTTDMLIVGLAGSVVGALWYMKCAHDRQEMERKARMYGKKRTP